ncbi:MAG: aminoglycoside phosphotransferase family protein [Devosia sp.]
MAADGGGRSVINPPDLAELQPILSDLGLAPPRAITGLAGGSDAAFRLDLADGTTLVLKTYDDLTGKAPAGESYATGLLANLDLPVARYLLRDETCTRLPFRYAITTYLRGSAVATFRDDPEIIALYREMGALLRRLHTIRLPGFGHFDADGVCHPVPDNATYMLGLAEHAFAQFRKYGASDKLATRLEAIVSARSDLFTQSRGPVFAHDDLHPNNVLADRDPDGRLHVTGVIDFGNARAADPIFDLAKTLFICEHDAPGSAAPIREGYGDIDLPDPEAALWLYTLLHRVVMWWWLRHVGVLPEAGRSELIVALEQMAAST